MTQENASQKEAVSGPLEGSVHGTVAPDGSIALQGSLSPAGLTKPTASPSPPCDEPEIEKSRQNYRTATAFMIGIGILWLLVSVFILPLRYFPVWLIWIITMGLFIAIGICLGFSISGRAAGIFINERKLMSISRVQIALWTLIILSAFFAIYIGRLRSGTVPDPLDIAIDWQLWAVMGISGASFVGRSVTMGKKGAVVPYNRDWEAKSAAKALGEMPEEIEKNRIGVLYANKCLRDAAFMDMFEGDEMRNTRFIDIGKLQMFFFTVIAIASYITMLFAVMYTTAPSQIDQLPGLSAGFVVILGISHAGFLGSGGVTNTPVKP